MLAGWIACHSENVEHEPVFEDDDPDSLITAETEHGWTRLNLPELGYVAGYGRVDNRNVAILIIGPGEPWGDWFATLRQAESMAYEWARELAGTL